MVLNKRPGDATAPEGTGKKVIVHVCNDTGKWGKGFVLALSKKHPKAEAEYLALYAKTSPQLLPLGTVQFVEVAPDVIVANMIAQRATYPLKDGTVDGCKPLRYDALLSCMKKVGEYAKANGASVHGPKFGSGLAGGEWEIIELMIDKVWCKDFGRDVTIYELDII